MKSVLKAPAKINICLKVNKKNDDGYHDLTMIMQNVSLYDILEVEILKNDFTLNYNLDSQINLTCNFAYIPTDDKNLIVKVVKFIFEKHNIKDKIYINLKKLIPTSAGLGGGSSDAASILLFLNKYYKLHYSIKELNAIALKFGSDIPFFLYKKECLCKGRGEIITPVSAFKGYYVLIATPDVRVSTKEIYEQFDTLALPDNLSRENDEKIERLLYSLERNDLEILTSNMFNDLELATMRNIADVKVFKDMMIEGGAYRSLMSGSGPTVFGIFPDLITAKRCKEKMKKAYNNAFVFVAKPV